MVVVLFSIFIMCDLFSNLLSFMCHEAKVAAQASGFVLVKQAKSTLPG